MPIEKTKLKALLIEYISGTISKDDLVLLLDEVANRHKNPELEGVLQELWDEIEVDSEVLADTESIFQSIITHSAFEKHTSPSKNRPFWWLSGAAAVLFLGICLSLGYWYAVETPLLQSETALATAITQLPKKEKGAILRLANGTEIDLDSVSNGPLAKQDNMQITLDGTELRYEGNMLDHNEQISWNTIIIPKGKQYQLTLPDGSKMWLNTGTTLTYPICFDSKVREVKIDGEAYFEIKKANKWPFIIKTNRQQVEVLGTNLNVSAYVDDASTKTTLITGNVRVSSYSDGNMSKSTTLTALYSEILVPGQQATTTEGDCKIALSTVDTEEIISWKQNLFVFNNEEISEVMKKVSRWYAVDVEFHDGMKGKRIGGTIPRFEHIDELMKALEATGVLHYKMEGGRVIIMK